MEWLMVSKHLDISRRHTLIYAWINDWVNNREAGDLRRSHYDVIVMIIIYVSATYFFKQTLDYEVTICLRNALRSFLWYSKPTIQQVQWPAMTQYKLYNSINPQYIRANNATSICLHMHSLRWKIVHKTLNIAQQLDR